MRDTIKAIIDGDVTLSGLLTGGTHAAVEISREETPGAFDATTKEILPCALVKLETDTAAGPLDRSGQLFAVVYFYERAGFTVTDQAIDLLRPLLHEQKIGDAADKVFEARWFNDVRDQVDPALESSLALSRFEIMRYKG